MENSYTKIFLKDIQATVRIGILPWEHEKPQRIIVNVEMFSDSTDYLVKVTANSIIDYSNIYNLVQGWQERPHTDLIETFVRELQAACFTYKDVAACRVSLSKPEIFDQAKGAGVEAFITREEFKQLPAL